MKETESGICKCGQEHASRPDIAALQADIGFANNYRLEVIKTLLAITTALLAFTISFRPTLVLVEREWLIVDAWIALAASTVAGVITLYCWERFYISYRDYDWKNATPAGEARRKTITTLRRCCFFIQVVAGLAGIVCVSLFAIVNLGNVALAAAAPATG